LIVLENDLYTRADEHSVSELIQAAEQVIVLDSFDTATVAKADFVLPAATFAEGDGTLVNNEGRAQRYFQVIAPQEGLQESWRWVGELMNLVDHELAGKWTNLDNVLHALVDQIPDFTPILEIAPPADFRIVEEKIPRQPFRYSGRTSMRANINVSEPKPPEDPDSPLAFSMEGYQGQPPASLISNYWSPGWNSVQSLNKFQDEVGGLISGGSPGSRLIEASEQAEVSYFQDVPNAFVPHQDEYLTIPLQHIFGSDELSRMVPAILERTPPPYLALNAALAQKFNVDEGQSLQIDLDGYLLQLPVRLSDALPDGTVGLPVGLPTIPAALPIWSKVSNGGGQA
jgi:NADH-quinone oxidoreductase subunit G